ncbi:MAG: hypothetical protein Q9160_001707 [Pyrenula sp. 1 TL-2023]
MPSSPDGDRVKGKVGTRYEIATKVQALVLYQVGIPMDRIMEVTGMSDVTVDAKLLDSYFKEGKRTGRPRKNPKSTEETPVEPSAEPIDDT